jgi:protein-tyrosine phosphatase
MLAAAAAAGYELAGHRARQLRPEDFVSYDLLLAMDRDNLREIRRFEAARATAPAALFLEWAGVSSPLEFPDPYFGEREGFDHAVALAQRGVAGLIERLRRG